MQQKIYILVVMLMAIASGACKKSFLNIYPEGQNNEVQFFRSTTDFKQAVLGAYVPLRDVANLAFWMDEMRSDNTEYEYNARDRGKLTIEQIKDFLDDAANPTISDRWTADYKGIQRTNVILDRIATISFPMADADKNQIIGEAKALRAHYYFDLARCYGGVPLYLHEVKGNTSAFVNRSPVDSVYMQIIADFTDALQLLKPPAGFPQDGRVTKGMVATELGLVHLTRKNYAAAITMLQSVTQMGYDLLPNYADVFALSSKNSRESIFEVQYKAGTDGQQSSFIFRFVPLSPEAISIFGISYNSSLDSYGGWNVPTDDIVSAYEPNDKRLDASIAVTKGKLNSSGDFVPDSVVSVLHPATPGVPSRRFVRKQYHPPYNLVYNSDDNWPLYRYADVLLMLAEALNEQHRSTEALPYLNRIRSRAGLKDITVTDQAQLRTIIAHERRMELAFENHRWFDLVRTGQAIPVMTAFGKIQKQKYGYLLPSSYTVTESRYIFAIPFREMQVNRNLKQNPGY